MPATASHRGCAVANRVLSPTIQDPFYMSLFGLDFTAEHPRVHDRDDLTRYMEGAGYILSHALVQVIVDEAAALNINASNAPRAEDMMVGMLLRRGAQHHGLVLQNGQPSLFAQPVETSAPRASTCRQTQGRPHRRRAGCANSDSSQMRQDQCRKGRG